MSKTQLFWAFVACIVLAMAVIILEERSIRKLQSEVDTARQNTAIALGQAETFRTRDSLSAARVKALQLTVDEYESIRQKDAATIQTLRLKNRDLQAVTAAQMETISQLHGQVRDSIVYRDRWHVDTLRCITIQDPWFSLQGCSDRNGRFTGSFRSRDSLLVVESVRYKRFLFWKTRRILDRQTDVVSRNPHTSIENVEVIVMERK